MRKLLQTASILTILPALTACGFLPQSHTHQKAYHASHAEHHQANNYNYAPTYNTENVVRSQGDHWCSNAGCAPKETYPVSAQPTAYYGTQTGAHNHHNTQAKPYAQVPHLRGPYKAKNSPYYYGNLGVVSYDTGNDLYGLQSRIGYQSNRFWGAEVEGSLGLDEDNVNDPVNLTTTRIDADYTAAAFALARLPLSERLSVHARGGYHATKFSLDVDDGTTVTELNDKFDGLAYGAGAEFNVTPKDAIRLDYTRYEGDSRDLDSISLGYARKF